MAENERLYRRERQRLVETLAEKGIDDPRVVKAIAAVPRHRFVDQALRRRAYNDEALPIGQNQTISQPFTVAYQTMLLDVKEDDRILEVGTGSGYQAAVLCELGARVFTIERHRELLERARAILGELDYRIVARCGDGSRGWNAFAPYDGVVVTAGATDVPEPLMDQLREPSDDHRGGRLVIPVGSMQSQTMMRYLRTGPDEYEIEEHPEFRFVPLVQEDDDR